MTLYTLTITNLRNSINNIPFFRIETDIRWIYCISHNLPLLYNYRMKLESFTPYRYLQYLRIEILPFSCLSDEELDNNFSAGYYISNNDVVWANQERENSVIVENDIFYLEGIVNLNRRERVTYDNFTQDKWFGQEWLEIVLESNFNLV